jgi:hypothetical protein
MSKVELDQGAICIDATIIAAGFAIPARLVQPLMRKRTITSLCERGIDADAGNVRLTFFYGRRRLCLVVDTAGNVIERSMTLIAGGERRVASRASDP